MKRHVPSSPSLVRLLVLLGVAVGACHGRSGGKVPESDLASLDTDGAGPDPDTASGCCLDSDPPVDNDVDDDGYAEDDCDDTNAEVHPDAFERCNGLDDDCDGVVDSDTAGWLDLDGDGYGTTAVVGCDDPTLPIAGAEGDCDDTEAGIHPYAAEWPCDGLDQDCDGLLAEVATVEGAASYDTIAAAVAAVPDGGKVWVCDGTYTELIDIEEGRTLTIAGWSGDAGSVVLDGQDTIALMRVQAYSSLTLEDMTLTRGNGLIDGLAEKGGGALSVIESTFVGRRLRFVDNSTIFRGGAVFLNSHSGSTGSNVSASFEDCLFSSNHANDGASGGAIGTYIFVDEFLELRMDGCTFEDNQAADIGGDISLSGFGLAEVYISNTTSSGARAVGAGGSMFFYADPTIVALDNVGIQGASSESGGGAISLQAFVPGTSMTIESSEISDCRSGADGGGIGVSSNTGSISVSVSSTLVEGCSAVDGGAFSAHLAGSSTLNMDDVTFRYNSSEDLGGALALRGDEDAVVSITGATIDENYSEQFGGGVFIGPVAGGGDGFVVEITDSSFTQNTATFSGPTALGGGIWLNSGAALSVVTSDFGLDDDANAPNDLHAPSGSYSDIGAGASFSCDPYDVCTGL